MSVPQELAERLEIYYRLLTLWNSKINLTGLNLSETTPESIDRLLIEPLVAAKHAPPGVTRMFDIGSGGGSPALPLALSIPGVRLVMVESKTRKSVFLREAVRALDLTGAEVVTARFEELLSRPDLHETQDLVTIRAVRLEARLFTSVQAFTKPKGVVFLFRSTECRRSRRHVVSVVDLEGNLPFACSAPEQSDDSGEAFGWPMSGATPFVRSSGPLGRLFHVEHQGPPRLFP